MNAYNEYNNSYVVYIYYISFPNKVQVVCESSWQHAEGRLILLEQCTSEVQDSDELLVFDESISVSLDATEGKSRDTSSPLSI